MISEDEIQEIIDKAETKAEAINELFDLGLTKGQIMSHGFKESTVRKEVDRRKREGKNVPGPPAAEASQLPVTLRGTERTNPAWMASRLAQLIDGSPRTQAFVEYLYMEPLYWAEVFGAVTKMNMMVLNQAKGESAKELLETLSQQQMLVQQASQEAAQQTAAMVIAGQKEAAIAGAKNPMAATISQEMAPLFRGMIQMLTRTMFPGMQGAEGQLPPGWKVTKREPEKTSKEGAE